MVGRRRINLAFVGSGRWAQRYHFPALRYLVHAAADEMTVDLCLWGIYSLEPEMARTVAAQYGFTRVYPDLPSLIEDPDVDAIAVVISPEALLGVMRQLVIKQVPVLSEKPPGISLQEARILSELVTVPNVVAFNRRYVPLNETFRQLVAETEGVYFLHGRFLRYQRRDPQFMIGTGVHWINLIEYVAGPIEHLHVRKAVTPLAEVPHWVAELTFAGGLAGQLTVFPCSGTQAERLEVHSSVRSLYLDGPLWGHPGAIVVESGDSREVLGAEGADVPEIVRFGIVGEYLDFFNHACAGLPTRSNFQNAVNTMRVAEAMQQGRDL